MFVYGRDVPLEVLVTVEGWTKVRDMQGAIGWIANKALADKRMLVVRVARRRRAQPAPRTARRWCSGPSRTCCSSSRSLRPRRATTATPGWVKVRHRDGQTGFVRIAQVFGL